MTLLKTALIGLGLILAYNWISNLLYTKLPLHIDGDHEETFAHVARAFRQNFLDGLEREGAALTVYHKGKKVVDLWGGYADIAAARKWTDRTLTVVFSSTKAVAALCVAMLVDRGHLKYSDLITKHWPEYGKHGKGNTTVQWALSHMAGLAYIDEKITMQDALDPNRMAGILENQKPNWPPGTASGYHALSFGWIVDQIIRHADPKKRGVGQFFRQEIARPYNIDFHIGLKAEEGHRVARMTLPALTDFIRELWTDFRILGMLPGYGRLYMDTWMARSLKNPQWLQSIGKMLLNNPDSHQVEQAAVLGIGNARSLAEIFELLIRGNLISPKLLQFISEPLFIRTKDCVTSHYISKGHGFLFHQIVRQNSSNDGRFIAGHPGHGGQNVKFDIKNDLVFAYVTNGLKFGLGDQCRTYHRISEAIYDVIEGKV